MAATHFFDSATPTSYSTPNTLWGLTRTVTKLPGGNLSITQLLWPSDLEYFRITVTDAFFFRNSIKSFSNSNKAISFRFSESTVGQRYCRYVQKIRHTCSEFRPKVGQSSPKTKFQIFTSPQNGGQFAPTLDSFYLTLKAVTCKCQFSGVDPLRGQAEAILAKNVRRGSSSGQTGSRNMAATRFLDFATPTSHSTPNTLLGLSRTVTELAPEAVTINAIVKASGNAKYSKLSRKCVFPTLSTFFSNRGIAIFFKFSESSTCSTP